jgi:UDP-2,3-diacylglucosamine hydrolase
LFQALSVEFAREGLEVIEQTRLLGHLLTPEGILGKRWPSRREWDDMRYGFAQAKQIVALDIGQTLVIRHRAVLAVEAIEGTDATIRRGCQFGRRGCVVIKVGRPQQDMRFDVPTVGPQTLQELIAGGASALAVETGTTMMVHRQELIAMANAHRIALVGVSPAILRQSEAQGERRGR